MPSTTPFFKAFGPLLFGRPARRSLQKIKRVNSLQELYELFGHLLSEEVLAASDVGVGSRERLYSTQVTFWAFAAQILSPGTACREMVRRVEAWWRERTGEDQKPSQSSSAYCQARARLDPATLELIRGQLCGNLERPRLEGGALAGRPLGQARRRHGHQQARHGAQPGALAAAHDPTARRRLSPTQAGRPLFLEQRSTAGGSHRQPARP